MAEHAVALAAAASCESHLQNETSERKLGIAYELLRQQCGYIDVQLGPTNPVEAGWRV